MSFSKILLILVVLHCTGESLYVPTSLVLSMAILAIFFCFSACLVLREKLKGRRFRYQRIGASHRNSHLKHENAHTNHGQQTYQDASDYALPPKQNVVTYCMIDKRLVDND